MSHHPAYSMELDKWAIWNNTNFSYPKDTPVHVLIEKIAENCPGKEAIRFNGQSVTYHQVIRAAGRMAAVLRSRGIKRGDRVGLAVDRSHQMLIALLAILKAGAAYIPLDPGYPDQRIQLMLEDAGTPALITSEKYKGRFGWVTAELLLEELWDTARGQPEPEQSTDVNGDDLAYMIYTSGSTGKPKGVMLEHHNLVNFLYSMMRLRVIGDNDRLLAVTTISFDIAALELFLPLMAGATVIIADTPTVRDGRLLLEILQQERVSVLQATPVTWKMILAAGWEEKLPLRMLCGGEALSPELAENLLQRGDCLFNLYGPTETTVWSTAAEIKTGDNITIGKPVGNTQVYILNEERKLVPPGEAGEIYIGGEGVARGYHNLPAFTAEKFLDDPFSGKPGSKMYRTGDLGNWTANGDIHFMGRMDQQIKIRGYRIEPGEIETALLAQTGIKDAVVIAREDIPGNRILAAYIIPSDENKAALDNPAPVLENWKRALRTALPDFMVPHEYVIIPTFPLLPNGKINRNGLPKPGKLPGKPFTDAGSAVTDTEKMIAGIWAESLQTESVGPDENFFELGGHSLTAVQIMTKLEQETGKRLPIAALFEAPTIRRLAVFLDGGNISASWGSLVPVKPGGSKPPLYIVHGDALNVMVFNSLAQHLDVDQPVFGLQPRGLNGIERPDESIEAMAAYYIEEIIRHNPSGPYLLSGYSFGGIVAFEMAKQMEAMGRQVKLVAMFDTNAGNRAQATGAGRRLRRKIALQFPKILFILRSFWEDPAAVIQYQAGIVKAKWKALLAKNKIDTEDELENLTQHEKEVILTHRAAFEKYHIVKYNIRIDLFKVKKRVYFVEDPVFLGWKPYAGYGVAVHEIPGDHSSFLLPPNDTVFAQTLQRVMDERVREH